MQMKQPPGGSFGVPPHIQEAHDKNRAAADAKRKAAEMQRPEVTPQEAPTSEPEVPLINDSIAEESDPEKILEKLGAKFDEEDFKKLLFKGYYETTIPAIKYKNTELKAKYKTLTGAEFDEVDEIIAAETREIPMTTEGFEVRKQMLIISFGVIELNGRPIAKPVIGTDKKIDIKATALGRREALKQLYPHIINTLIRDFRSITVAVNMIISNPGNQAKNS